MHEHILHTKYETIASSAYHICILRIVCNDRMFHYELTSKLVGVRVRGHQDDIFMTDTLQKQTCGTHRPLNTSIYKGLGERLAFLRTEAYCYVMRTVTQTIWLCKRGQMFAYVCSAINRIIWFRMMACYVGVMRQNNCH